MFKKFLGGLSVGLVAGLASGFASAALTFRAITGDSLLEAIFDDFDCDGDCAECDLADECGCTEGLED